MPNPGTTKAGTKRGLAAAERRRKALELRKAGAGYEQIARELGYYDATGAYKAIQTALKDVVREPAEDVRTLELERLDRMLLGLWERARKGDTLAIDRVLKIMERRSRYLGIDAPEPTGPAGEVDPLLARVVAKALGLAIPDDGAESDASDP